MFTGSRDAAVAVNVGSRKAFPGEGVPWYAVAERPRMSGADLFRNVGAALVRDRAPGDDIGWDA